MSQSAVVTDGWCIEDVLIKVGGSTCSARFFVSNRVAVMKKALTTSESACGTGNSELLLYVAWVYLDIAIQKISKNEVTTKDGEWEGYAVRTTND